MLINEIADNLTNNIIPFWKRMKDEEYGGFYGRVDYELKLYKRTSKYSIYNCRIMWFFLQAYKLTGDEECKSCAMHAYQLIMNHCIDKTYGGLYWSLTYDCRPEDTAKYTFSTAYAILALSSYYEITHDTDALRTAYALQELVEKKCRDEFGYLEAFDETYTHFLDGPAVLSEGCYSGEKTANTVLHLLEAYTELYRVDRNKQTAEYIKQLMKCFSERIYNKKSKQLNIFLDNEMNLAVDYFSFGHDIETAWLINKCCDILPANEYTDIMREISKNLVANIYENAYSNNSIADEISNGEIVNTRVFWVQAEAVVGFFNAWKCNRSRNEYLEAASNIWQFIKTYIIDKRPGGEWLHDVSISGEPNTHSAIAGPWKGPYHNGRMCIELIQELRKNE